MNRYVMTASLVVLLAMGGVFLWRSSQAAEKAGQLSFQFLQWVTAGKLRKAYHHMSRELQNKYKFASFAKQLLPLREGRSIKQTGAFANWSWTRVMSQIKTPEGRLFDVELVIRRERGKERIFTFKFGEHGLGLTLTFLGHLQKQQLKQAYQLMSASYQKQFSLQEFAKRVAVMEVHRSSSFHWEPVKQTRKILTHFDVSLRYKDGKQRLIGVDVVREKDKLMVQSLKTKDSSLIEDGR